MVVPVSRRKFLSWSALGLAASAGASALAAGPELVAWPGTWDGPGQGRIVWSMHDGHDSPPWQIGVWRFLDARTASEDCGILIEYHRIAGEWVSSIPECTIQRALLEWRDLGRKLPGPMV